MQDKSQVLFGLQSGIMSLEEIFQRMLPSLVGRAGGQIFRWLVVAQLVWSEGQAVQRVASRFPFGSICRVRSFL